MRHEILEDRDNTCSTLSVDGTSSRKGIQQKMRTVKTTDRIGALLDDIRGLRFLKNWDTVLPPSSLYVMPQRVLLP